MSHVYLWSLKAGSRGRQIQALLCLAAPVLTQALPQFDSWEDL